MEKYLRSTKLLDYKDPHVQKVLLSLNLNENTQDSIRTIYNFVRDGIAFGYNKDDRLPASKVLKDGYGQCNTKGILFMALLRGASIPCRIHGFAVDKDMQKGAMTGIVYKSAPREIFHSWVEIYYKGQWLELEGFILDMDYLSSLQKLNPGCSGSFCGYGVSTSNFKKPPVDWNENNTYIQRDSIIKDYGIYADPDELFDHHGQKLSILKTFLYRNLGRHLMNRNVKKIRSLEKGD